jgi:hypothetical protein
MEFSLELQALIVIISHIIVEETSKCMGKNAASQGECDVDADG